MVPFSQPFDFSVIQQIGVVDDAIGRLLMACLLGGAIGLERELKNKAAGVRTNLLIAMSTAFFTLLSPVLAGVTNGDKSRVTANIVTGIGFLGAGVILRQGNKVSGLTSAASIFAVASIGMACGAGLYAPAAVAAVIVIAVLQMVGFLERHASLKRYSLLYEARGLDQTKMLEAILGAMDKAGERLTDVERDEIGVLQRVSFSLSASKKKHDHLQAQVAAEPAISELLTFRDSEDD